MQPKEFKYTLIVPGIDNYVLLNAPKGWEDNTEIDFARSDTYSGVVRSLTVPLDFVTDGAKILRREWYKYNVQAQVFIQIDKLDTSTWDYNLAYYGKLDFSKAEDSDDFFRVNATEADISVKIKAFENTVYEIPVDVPESVDIQLTPLKLIESADLIFIPSQSPQQPGYVELQVVNNEVKSVNSSVKDVQYRTDITPDFANDSDWFFFAQTDTVLKVKIENLQGFVTNGSFGQTKTFTLRLIKSNNDIIATLFNATTPATLPIYFNINQEYTFNIVAGEKIFLYEYNTGTVGGGTGFNYTNGSISLSYETLSPPTMCKALRPKYVFQQLVKQMNGTLNYPIQSFLLDEWEQLTITCGDAVRQIAGSKIKLSFSSFFKSISAVTCAGHGVENGKATIEYRRSYYRNVKTLSMPDSTGIKLTPALDLMFNSVKTGYKDQTYDEVNGRDEVNSEQSYVIDVTAPQRELDITSEIRADAYGIEFLRINLEGKTSTDSDSDNDTFFVYINKQPVSGQTYYKPMSVSDAGGTITGVTAGNSYYNWYISPKQNLIRWGAYISSIFFGNEGYRLRFVKGLKNTEMVIIRSGKAVSEKANLPISDLAEPYFMPYYATFNTSLPNDFWELMNNAVYGFGTFVYQDIELKGYFISMSVDLATNSQREPKLLLTTDNNLLQLIR